MPFRIVVADKNAQAAVEMMQIVANRDIQCLHVDSAAGLKQAIKSQKPSLIVLSPFLKDTPSWRATEKIISAIKKSHEYGETKVALLKGYPGGPPDPQLESMGADGFLEVPLKPTETIHLIESFMNDSDEEVYQTGDDDIVIDFDDYEDQIESYVEDTPMELTSDSQVMFEDNRTEHSNQQFQSTTPLELIEDINLIHQDQEITELSYNTTDEKLDVESLPTLEGGDLDYIESTTPSHDANFSETHDSMNQFGELDESHGADTDIGIDFSQQYERVKFAEPIESHAQQHQSPELPETNIDAKEELLTTIEDILPEKSAILDHLERAFKEVLPRREELLELVRGQIYASLPSHEEFVQAAIGRLRSQIGETCGLDATSANLSVESTRVPLYSSATVSPAPKTQIIEEKDVKWASEGDRPSPSQVTVDGLVRNIIHEKIEEIMPAKEEILHWIRNEMDERLWDVVEKIIRQKLEEITSDAS